MIECPFSFFFLFLRRKKRHDRTVSYLGGRKNLPMAKSSFCQTRTFVPTTKQPTNRSIVISVMDFFFFFSPCWPVEERRRRDGKESKHLPIASRDSSTSITSIHASSLAAGPQSDQSKFNQLENREFSPSSLWPMSPKDVSSSYYWFLFSSILQAGQGYAVMMLRFAEMKSMTLLRQGKKKMPRGATQRNQEMT